MNSLPLVSIITPSYNQAKYLERTILSVLEQTYPNIEYIVMDGGSNDGSVALIERYADRISYWESQKDKGQTDAINKGFNRASGEIIAWLNSDDTYEADAVVSAVAALQAHPDASFLYGDCHFIDAEDHVIGKFNAKQTDLVKLKRGFVHVPQQAFFFRRTLWEQVGPLDDSIFFAMDYDLWLRLAAIRPPVYLPGHAWANFRLHEDAKTVAADSRCWQDMLKIHRRNGGTVFSALYAKYLLRKLLAPVITWRRRKLFQNS